MSLGQPKRRSRTGSFIAFARRHKIWQVLLPLAVVSVLLVLLLQIMTPQEDLSREKQIIPALAAGNENVVEILPQTEREDETLLPGEEEAGLIIDAGSRLYPAKDPFADAELTNVTYSGAILSGNGSGVAIMQASGTSYIVRTGDFVGESAWQVDALTADSVTLKNGAMTRVLYTDKTDLPEIIMR